jgi:hypothetical protein
MQQHAERTLVPVPVPVPVLHGVPMSSVRGMRRTGRQVH